MIYTSGSTEEIVSNPGKRRESRSALSEGATHPAFAKAAATSGTLIEMVIDPRHYKMGSGQSFAHIFRAAPHEKIWVIKRGLSAEHVGALAEVMDMPKETL
jgi:hypothetical protein